MSQNPVQSKAKTRHAMGQRIRPIRHVVRCERSHTHTPEKTVSARNSTPTNPTSNASTTSKKSGKKPTT